MWRNFFHFSFSTKICWESSYEYCIILILWWRNKWFIRFSVSVQLTKWFRFYIKQCLSHDIQHDNNENVLSYLQRKLFIFPSHQWHISEYEHVVMLSSFFFVFLVMWFVIAMFMISFCVINIFQTDMCKHSNNNATNQIDISIFWPLISESVL